MKDPTLKAGKSSVYVEDSEAAMGVAAADFISAEIKKAAGTGKRTVLWLMSAPSAFAFYSAFTDLCCEGERVKEGANE